MQPGVEGVVKDDAKEKGVTIRAALGGVPRINRAQWQGTHWFVRWLLAARASVLLMTVFSAIFAAIAVLPQGGFNLLIWLLCTLGVLFAHATNNLMNDLVDFRLGIDRGNYYRLQYGTHVLEDDLMSQRQVLLGVMVTGGAAILCGVVVLTFSASEVLVPAVLGALLLLFYTWPLKKWGLGEVAVFLAWGPLMVGGMAYAMTGQLTAHVLAVSVLAGLGPTTVIFGKHIDKAGFDQQKGVQTLPVRLGEALARRVSQWLVGLMYVLVLAFVLLGWMPAASLVVALSVPIAYRTWRVFDQPKPDSCPTDYPDSVWPLWFVAHSFEHNRWYGLLLLVGLIIGAVFAWIS